MPSTIRVAAIQMDATPAPKIERLARAEALLQQAAEQGAQLAVLPELFNLGYSYDDAVYEAAEAAEGLTFAWLRHQAAQHALHIVGSWLVVVGDHVYNRAVLVAPDGRTWDYDKNYPWAYERAFFRESDQIRIADTDLGRFGLMICWDSAHAEQWARYAGQVQAMLIPSCPPNMQHAELVFPDGARYPIGTTDKHFADGGIQAQAAWMGIPAIHAGGSGAFRSPLPAPNLMLLGIGALNAALLGRLPEAAQASIETDFGRHTMVMDASGTVIARVTEPGDQVALSLISLPDVPPIPEGEQPRFAMHRRSYWMIDILSPALLSATYQRGVRRQWGGNMAQAQPRTRALWLIAGLLFGMGFLLGKRQR